jgi:hypothetical protein
MARYGVVVAALVACASLVLAGCVRPAAVNPDQIGLEQIIANNEAAVNGHTDTTGIRSMQVDLAMKDGKSSFDAVYKVTRDGRMRIDIIQGGKRVYTEAYDGHAGWDLGEDGSAAVTDRFAAALWHGTQYPGGIFSLRDVAAHGHKLKYIGRENIDGVNYHVVEIVLSDGFTTSRYINPATWMIERGRDFRAFHPAINDKKAWIETVWSDYRPVEGVMRAFVSVNNDLGTGQWQATNTVKGFKLNPDFDPSIFAKPADPAR